MRKLLKSKTWICSLIWLAATPLTLTTFAQQHADATIKVDGQMVLPDPLPEEAQPDALDFSRLEGTLSLLFLPGTEEKMDEILGKPDNFDEMTQQEQRDWLKQAARHPDFLQRSAAAAKLMKEAGRIPPVPLVFEQDGSFKASGLRPGIWSLKARIPHKKESGLSHAEIDHKFTVKADSTAIDLGRLTLNIHHVLVPGDPAPDFTALTYDGKSFKLSDYRGKHVLIDFWATWCGPCVAGIPDLVEVHEEFAGERFEVIGLSLDKTMEAAVKFHEKKPSPYVHAYAGERSESKAAKQYGVRLIPSIWLIGPDGRILARDLRGDAIRKAVAKALDTPDK